MAPEALSAQQVDEALSRLPGWTVDHGKLTRAYTLGRHMAAAAMAVHIAAVQDELNHHSELTLGYDSLGVAVNTHSAGGAITELDVALARRIEEIASGHGAS